ncbi:sigma-54 dependent transcriptional regulator [uncultured Umboniibacter sp.]|uniref:sigma-54-dependent transcriptional regulator n=1 Tax=uncultured Umboniibacter sp. TaxID=1798917 RepID=UPI002601E64C|nr:sigma-54 dependent transcriptional regulator [uncultured Umboniibacter sp.]
MPHILVVEDEAIIRGSIKRLLLKANYQVSEATSVADALSKGELHQYDLILSDLRMPGGEGTELIPLASETPVLIMTSYASMKTAVDALKAGAADYIAKPFSNQDLLSSVAKNCREKSKTAKDSNSSATQSPISKLIGQSAPMKKLFKMIYKVAATDATVLVNGETGTGKELIAQAIHQNSNRAGNALVSVNCAAIPDTLIEAELFGHEKGAFTGADSARSGLVSAAHQGTLFLDEIGELPLAAQARLLRVLQEGEVRAIGSVQPKLVDVRIVAATHRNLKRLVENGEFREDLYYRLNVIQLVIPALRDRGGDKLEIANSLLTRYLEKFDRPATRFSVTAEQAIAQYPWPGNVRELENAVQRGVILSEPGNAIEIEDLGIEAEQSPEVISEISVNSTSPSKAPSQLVDSAEAGEDLEEYFQRFVLENQDAMSETELARRLGVSRKCLWERRQRLGIPRKRSSVQPVS